MGMAEEAVNTTGLALPPDKAGNIDIRAPRTLQEAFTIAQYLAASGIFKDVAQARKAFGLIAIGMDLGLSSTQSIRSIHMIEGKPELGADIIACLLKKAGYRWKIERLDRECCELRFFDPEGNDLGVSDFDIEDAHAAGLAGKQNWRAYARNMLFARAISNGARWFAPEVFGGAVYYRSEIDQSYEGDPGGPDAVPETPPGAPEPEVIEAEVVDDAELSEKIMENAKASEGYKSEGNPDEQTGDIFADEHETKMPKAHAPHSEEKPKAKRKPANWFKKVVSADAYKACCDQAKEAGVNPEPFFRGTIDSVRFTKTDQPGIALNRFDTWLKEVTK